MRVLFVHQNFPGQYRHVAPALAARPGTEVVALGINPAPALPGVRHLRYTVPGCSTRDPSAGGEFRDRDPAGRGGGAGGPRPEAEGFSRT